MPVKVVDASALAALLFGEPEAEAVVVQLGDARLVAPALLEFELANICPIKSRRHPEQRPVLTAAFGGIVLHKISRTFAIYCDN